MNPCSPRVAGRLVCLLALITMASIALAKSADTDAERRHRIAQVVNRALDASPEIAAARSAIQAAQARLTGAGLPRGALEQVARQELLLAREQYEALKLEKSRELLATIGRITIGQEIVELARQRTELLARFEKLAVKRHAAGDIPRNDLELARLSLAEASMQQARRHSELLQTQTDFHVLAGQPLPEPLPLPLQPGTPGSSDADETLAREHPEVQSALIAAQAARQQVLSADRGRKADPTFGVAAGQEDSETLVALSFSLPLQVRNDYQSDVDAARAEALQADQLAQQSYRTLLARIAGSLLDTLWQSGEISTTDYLLQLQQTLDTRITGTELQGELWSAWVHWLAASGTLENWLNGK